tara:strand:- start:5982 stop:7067 length:1086 start_codon:yes stop_codon:yes gene_type:complete
MLQKNLRRGWTTGACATAASKAAFIGLVTGKCPDIVTIKLPNGQSPKFNIAYQDVTQQSVSAGVIKDAGDDPDVTDGLLIISKIVKRNDQNGIYFKAGNGVGTVTLPGLPLDVGEPAINPGPRKMIEDNLKKLSIAKNNLNVDIIIEVPEGKEISKQTWNERLGIINGISILGTTGIVIPFSCSAWIHSIHRGIDVAIKTNTLHIAACTGSVSEKAAKKEYNLSPQSMIDMGDFVGGMLKYLKKNTVPRVTIAGGFAKLLKLSQGEMDLHSSRSQVNLEKLRSEIKKLDPNNSDHVELRKISTANQCLSILGPKKYELAKNVAVAAQDVVVKYLKKDSVSIDIMIVDRTGDILAKIESRDA